MKSSHSNFATPYLLFLAIYISLVITSNLIFQYYIQIDITKNYFISISAGLIAFPFTFLITDIICEIYGKKKSQFFVIFSFIAVLASVTLIKLVLTMNQAQWSPTSYSTFNKIFGVVDKAFLSSLVATFITQFFDISLFHYFKQKTQNKHLWFRNIFSTIISQLLDSFLVLLILIYFNIIPQSQFLYLFISAVIYKILFAILDTPLIYFFVWWIKKTK